MATGSEWTIPVTWSPPQCETPSTLCHTDLWPHQLRTHSSACCHYLPVCFSVCVRGAFRSVGSASSRTWSLPKKWPKMTMTASRDPPRWLPVQTGSSCVCLKQMMLAEQLIPIMPLLSLSLLCFPAVTSVCFSYSQINTFCFVYTVCVCGFLGNVVCCLSLLSHEPQTKLQSIIHLFSHIIFLIKLSWR